MTNFEFKPMKEVNRRLRSLSGLAVWLLASFIVCAQSSNPGFETFKRFVTGKEPVKEALVYRKISYPDGKILNQDWLRFGYQVDSWYAQRLAPDANDLTKLLPAALNEIHGASFAQLWVVTDSNLHVAHKTSAHGSVPEMSGAFPRNFMLHSLALGIPHIKIENIKWDGLKFTSKVVTKRDSGGFPVATNTLTGSLALGADGLPVTAEYSGVGSFPGAVVSYEYGSFTKGIPAVFTTKLKEKNETSYRYEFLSLTLGKADLKQTGGYVPQMFVDASVPRMGMLWTNDLPYTVQKDKITAAFLIDNRRRTGSLILGTLLIIVIAFLTLWYRRSKKQNQ